MRSEQERSVNAARVRELCYKGSYTKVKAGLTNALLIFCPLSPPSNVVGRVTLLPGTTQTFHLSQLSSVNVALQYNPTLAGKDVLALHTAQC